MALGKINDPNIPDIRKLNKLLQEFEGLKQTVKDLQNQTAAHNATLDTLTQYEPVTVNNVVFTWTTGTMSWTAGYAKLKDGTVYTIDSGSRALTASTYYWCIWDHANRKMGFNSSLGTVFSTKNTIVLCQVFAGTGAQTGTAGGSGTVGNGSGDISGDTFKNF